MSEETESPETPTPPPSDSATPPPETSSTPTAESPEASERLDKEQSVTAKTENETPSPEAGVTTADFGNEAPSRTDDESSPEPEETKQIIKDDTSKTTAGPDDGATAMGTDVSAPNGTEEAPEPTAALAGSAPSPDVTPGSPIKAPVDIIGFVKRHRKPVIIGAVALVLAVVAFSLVGWLSPQQLNLTSVYSGYEIKYPQDWTANKVEGDPDACVIAPRASGPRIVTGTAPFDGSSTSGSKLKKAFDSGVDTAATIGELPDVVFPSPESRDIDGFDCLYAETTNDNGSYAAYGTAFGDTFATVVVFSPRDVTPGMKTTVDNIVESLSIKAVAYEVTFKAEGKEIDKGEAWDLGHGASIKTPEAPVIDKKAFDRWTADKGANVEAEGGSSIVTDITSDTTVVAEYVPAYTVTFLDANGGKLKVEHVKTGGSITPPPGPEKARNKFVKWDTPTTNVTKDLTVKPVYEPVWTVTFTDGNGGVFATVEVDNGASASVSKNPTKDGFTFEGWSASTANVKSDLTVDPVFKKIPTKGEKNALGSALSYLKYMPFSYTGLIKQLEYEKYSHEEAVYAADNCGADWNEQAAKCAKNYLEYMSFSRGGLIDQLVYEGFTQEQATYGVDKAGL